MDVLLINPNSREPLDFPTMPPLGLASIGSLLENNGFSVKVLDLELKVDDFDPRVYISNLSPKVVGISGTSYSRFKSFSIASIVKEVSSEIFTVYGGPHATFTGEDTLFHINDIDYIVHGEGEITFLELVNFLIYKKGTISNIKGISFRCDGKIVQNAPRERITDLDSIPYSRHLLEIEKYRTELDFLEIPAVSIITSRGCPYNCYFCSASAMFGNKHTMRSAKNIVDEIHYCINKFNIKGIKFYDDCLTLNRQHILSLTHELKERNVNLPWECEIRVDTVDKLLLQSMKESGCYYVDLGIESASENVLKTIGKRISIGQAIDVLKWCKEFDIKTKVFFSFGHIGETWRDVIKTIKFMNKYCNYISKYGVSPIMKIYPGTRLEKQARENGFLPEDFSWSEPFENAGEDIIDSVNIPIIIQPSFGIKQMKKVRSISCWIYISQNLNFKEYFKQYRLQNLLRKLKETKSFSHLFYCIAKEMFIIFKIVMKKCSTR